MNEPPRADPPGMALFALGFRPFFLSAGIAAVVLMTIWLLGYTKREPLLSYYGASGWHAHEMLFGYVAAVIAGFLLTAVRNWTSLPTVQGLPLAALVLLWAAGRVLPLLDDVPPWMVALVDFSFLPLLALALALPLLRAGQRRNLFILLALAVLMIANVLVHGEWLGYTMATARIGIMLAIYTIVLLITIIAGRVIPFFIESGIKGAKVPRWPLLDAMCVITVVALGFADLFSPIVEVVVACAVLAAVVHAGRLWSWFARAAWSQALLGVLLLGYAWLVLGFVLLAVAYSGYISPMLAFHALMAGGMGVLTLGMMARVALGHTGRPMQASRLITFAFVLLNMAVVVRVFGPLLTLRYGQAVISAAGALWIVSFALFLLVYAPILLRPRVDGQPG